MLSVTRSRIAVVPSKEIWRAAQVALTCRICD